jgi:hypothetical protein
MATYAEYLKSNGATEEDVKVLDTPIARKAFERMEAAVVAKDDEAKKAKAQADAYQAWYNDKALPYVSGVESKLSVAEANLAAERTRLKSLQDAGLLELSEQDEAAKKAAVEAEKRGAVTFDPEKFVPREQFNELATRAADSITLVADLAQEHTALGLPPVSWRTLKAEASAANQDVETYWKTKFNVEAKRSERSATERAAYEKKISDDAVAKYKAEHPASSVNPALAFGGISANPFTGKVPSASDATLPWQRSDSEKVNSRISKVLTSHPDISGNA